jgi:putative Mg2+ transporter-C (MgtC) family protein
MDALSNFGMETVLPFPVVAGRLALAVLLGGLVGFEREWRERPAGLRAHILVCLASAMFALIMIEISLAPGLNSNSIRIDPGRLVEAITSGVAFLAAGVIIFSRGEVHGLTTGAGMWLAASIGLACGLGLWKIAVFATLLGIIVLSLLHQLEVRLASKWEKKRKKVEHNGNDARTE